jgi:pyrimidine deaminase RibD-like protein
MSTWRAAPRAAELRGGRDLRWLERAARAAEEVEGRWKVGCVIVKSGRVLAVAANSARNDPSVLDGRYWLASEHAEMAALRLAAYPRGATAYVARIGAGGEMRHAQPCLRCQRWLDEYGVSAVWTSDDEYIRSRQP